MFRVSCFAFEEIGCVDLKTIWEVAAGKRTREIKRALLVAEHREGIIVYGELFRWQCNLLPAVCSSAPSAHRFSA